MPSNEAKKKQADQARKQGGGEGARRAQAARKFQEMGGTQKAQKGKKRAQAAEKKDTYVVQSGDSLSKIAKQVYGDAGRWPEIFEANKDQIEDPNLIHPGQELRIP